MQHHTQAQITRGIATSTTTAASAHFLSSSVVLEFRLPTAGPAHKAYAAVLKQQRQTRMMQCVASQN